jgi:hypothetical protein
MGDHHETDQGPFGALAGRCGGHGSILLSRGRFEETLRPDRAIPVAHIDCDWHDPVALCLESVWQHLVVDGRIVLDDYNDWEGAASPPTHSSASTLTPSWRSACRRL